MIDILIYTVGYETRSSFVARTTAATHRIALIFDRNREYSFAENATYAAAAGDDLLELSDDLQTRLGERLDRAIARQGPMSARPVEVAIDVSSMTRALMAQVVKIAFGLMQRRSVALRFLYAPASYQPPSLQSQIYVNFEPVSGYEGWTAFPERPMSVILGLGYEADLAVGTVEYLDPSGIWGFVPIGRDSRFRRDLEHANRALWSMVQPAHRLDYRLDNPAQLYAELRGLVESLAQRSRVVLVPGGPKLFSALSLLVKLEMGNEVSVWRASTHDFGEVRNIEPNGDIVEFRYPRSRIVRTAQAEVA